MSSQFRDLTLLPLSATEQLVIACDSSAGIGAKQADMVSVPTEVMSAYCLRVPLLELLCFGAQPLLVVDTVGNEMQPTGERVIAGLRQELAKAALADLPLNGSTEDNMTTVTTSVGVTVIGKRGIKPRTQYSELMVYRLGTPYVGQQVVAHLDTIFAYNEVRQLVQQVGVVDLLPVGSKGIRYELEQMATTQRLTPQLLVADQPILEQSAGPATVLLIAVQPEAQAQLKHDFPKIQLLAKLKSGRSTNGTN
ncbi:hypothetical protein [Loigolactobacillus jiayinensis]|uniref:Alpha-ribazole kinase n=1 Tax=Loigolactobacillus jiayinensis TaxID=2486016 RepID=A0ABW1RDR6_9LACO|nr:hypothetical protein [Loigolactobacillus jiayinensis]